MTGGASAALLDLLQHLDAAHVGHANVEQDEIGRLLLREAQAGSPAAASTT